MLILKHCNMYKLLLIINFISMMLSSFGIMGIVIANQFSVTLYSVPIWVLSIILLRLFYSDSDFWKNDDIEDDGYSI